MGMEFPMLGINFAANSVPEIYPYCEYSFITTQ